MARSGLAFTKGYLDRSTLAVWLERWMETKGRDGEFMTYLMCRHSMGESMGRVNEWIVKDGQTALELLPIVWDTLEEYALGVMELEPQFKFVPHFGKERVPGPPSPFKFRKPMIDDLGQAADGGEDEKLEGPINERSLLKLMVAQNIPERKMNLTVSGENSRMMLAINQAQFAEIQMLRGLLTKAEEMRQTAFQSWQDAADTSMIRKLDAEKQAKADARKDAIVGKVAMLIPYAIKMGLTKFLGPQAGAIMGATSNPQLEKLKGALAQILNDETTMMKMATVMSEKNSVAATIVFDVIQEWSNEAQAAKAKIDESVERVAGPSAVAALGTAAVPEPSAETGLAKAP